MKKIPFLQRNPFVEKIYSAKFKEEPAGYTKINAADIQRMISAADFSAVLPKQEKGIRRSLALPYELAADSSISADKKYIVLSMQARNQAFGKQSAGTPYTVIAPGKYTHENGAAEVSRNWAFAVAAGDTINYQWPVDAFENGQYHLRLYGPNGFYREYTGNTNDPMLNVSCMSEYDINNRLTGNILIKMKNIGLDKDYLVKIKDNGYGNKGIQKELLRSGSQTIILSLAKTYGWYDFSLTIDGISTFEKRYAGRVETGKESFSDPLMGGMV